MSAQDLPATTPRQLCIAAALCFCAGGLYGWSALVPLVENTFAGSTAQAGSVFSIAIVSFTVAVLLVPRLNADWRRLYASGLFGMIGVVCLLLAAAAGSYWQFLVFFSVGFGFVSGALYINVLTMAADTRCARWVTPVLVAMFGFGGVVFGPLWRQMIAHGWQANSLLPLAALLFISALVALCADNRPAAPGLRSLLPRRLLRVPATQDVTNDVQTRYSRRLLLIWAIFATGSMAGLMALGLASKIIEHAGGSVKVASAGIAGIALGNTLGRLCVSVQLCFIGVMPVALLATLTGAAGLLLVLSDDAGGSPVIGLSLVALGYGTTASAIPVMVQRQFGAGNFSRFYSVVFTAWGLAGLSSPWIAGALFDASGNFTSAIQLALAATVLSSLLLLCLAATDSVAGKSQAR